MPLARVVDTTIRLRIALRDANRLATGNEPLHARRRLAVGESELAGPTRGSAGGWRAHLARLALPAGRHLRRWRHELRDLLRGGGADRTVPVRRQRRRNTVAATGT